MATKAGGGARASSQRVKDQARAADLKKRGIGRTVARCPICNRVVAINGFYGHIVTCVD